MFIRVGLISQQQMNGTVNIDKAKLADFCRRWKALNLALFGSAIRDDFRDDSDVDFLVSFQDDAAWDLADLAAMRTELEELVGRPVDLVERAALHNPFRRREILATHRVLYAA